MFSKQQRLFLFSPDMLFKVAAVVTVIAIVVVALVSRTTVFSLEVRFYIILAISFPAIAGCLFATIYQAKVSSGNERQEQVVLPVVTEEEIEEFVGRLEEYSRLLEARITTTVNLMKKEEECKSTDHAIGAVNEILEYEVKRTVSEVKRADLVLSIVEDMTEESRPVNRSLWLNGA